MPYQFDHVTAVISASIGYTLVPGDSGDPDSLLRHADQAMYVAKQEGRNRFHLFDVEQDLRIRHKRENLSRVKKHWHFLSFDSLSAKGRLAARQGGWYGSADSLAAPGFRIVSAVRFSAGSR